MPDGPEVWKGYIIPVALAASALLHLLGIDALVAVLGEVTRKMFRGSGGAFGQTDMVTVVGLVRTGHLGKHVSLFVPFSKISSSGYIGTLRIAINAFR